MTPHKRDDDSLSPAEMACREEVINADGSQSSLVCDETVPPGQKFVGNVSCVGILSQA